MGTVRLQSSTDVPALLPCVMLPRETKGTRIKEQLTKPTVKFSLSLFRPYNSCVRANLRFPFGWMSFMDAPLWDCHTVFFCIKHCLKASRADGLSCLAAKQELLCSTHFSQM